MTHSPMSAASRFYGLSRAAKRVNATATGLAQRAVTLAGFQRAGTRALADDLDQSIDKVGVAGAVTAAIDDVIVEATGGPRGFAAARAKAQAGAHRTASAAPAARSGVPRTASLKPHPMDAKAQARTRTSAVFASPHSVGRERQAADMIATSMAAGEIVGLLAKAPRQATPNDMLASLAATPNPILAPGNSDLPSGASAETFWAKVRASNQHR